MRVNAQTQTHAEGQVVQQAKNAGMAGTANSADLYVEYVVYLIV